MERLMRTHLAIAYDELWAEHVFLSTGKIVKPFKDRHSFSWTDPKASLEKGFMSIKPKEFIEIDNLIKIQYSHIIELADNRMMQGDYRYGHITDQHLENYDFEKAFIERYKRAMNSKNLEDVIDAYNMIRIQYYKVHNRSRIIPSLKLWWRLFMLSLREKWALISIDDGKHTKEK